MLLALLMGTAMAWELVPADPLALPDGGGGAALVERDGQTLLVASGSAETWVIAPLSGSVSESIDVAAHAVLPRDQDGDALADLLLCTDEGLVLVGWPEPGPTAPAVLHAVPCHGLVEHHLAGHTGVAVATDLLVLLDDDGAGTFDEAWPTDVSTSAEVLLASTEGRLAVSAIDAWRVVEIGEEDALELPAGGQVGGLAVLGDHWAWTLSSEAQLALSDGAVFDVDNRPGPLAVGDLDGDGGGDLVLLHPTRDLIGVIPASDPIELTFAGGLDGTGLLVGDLDLDGCDDVVVLTAAEAVPWLVVDCPVVGTDDCDGEYGSVRLQAVGRAEEGASLDITAHLDGCFPSAGELRWVAPEVDIATCWATGATARCDLRDDGEFSLRVDRLDGDDLVIASTTLVVKVINLPPVFEWNCEWSGEERLYVGQEVDTWLEATDVPQDTVSFDATGGPPGLVLTPNGHVTYTAIEEDVGWWTVDVRAADEDGGEAWETVDLEVAYREPWSCSADDEGGCAGLCCSSSSGMAFLVTLVGLRRRRL